MRALARLDPCSTRVMPRDLKQSHDEDEQQGLPDAPRVDEEEIEEDERALASLAHKSDKYSEYDDDEDDIVEDIDLDDLSAMEGPDA
jgi:hypothetical protein